MQQVRCYEFCRGEPAVFSEIYLPKKSVYQGRLYDTLTRGFDIDNIKEHFIKKESKIKELLRRYNRLVGYDRAFIDEFPRVFFGYSMYEVDGVFYDIDKGITAKEHTRIVEERTQIIRIIFKPDMNELDRLFNKVIPDDAVDKDEFLKILARTYLSHSSSSLETFFEDEEKMRLYQEVFKYLQKWTDYTGLFMFGYLIYEISELILSLFRGDKIGKVEDVIWVTSLWNLSVNRIVPQIEEGNACSC